MDVLLDNWMTILDGRLNNWMIAVSAGTGIIIVLFIRPGLMSGNDLTKITNAKELHDAKTANRDLLIKIVGVGVVVGAFVVSNETNQASRDALQVTQDTLGATEKAQIADLYSKTLEQLGSDNQTVRIGGIATLKSLLTDGEHHNAVRDVLAGFVRANAKPPTTPIEPFLIEEPCFDRAPIEPSLDVQEAVIALVERDSSNEDSPLDLHGVYLAGIRLPADSNLNNTILDYADLSYSQMSYVDLISSSIKHARFFQACLIEANLSEARSTDYVNFERAVLSSADLRGSEYDCANMRYAIISNSKVTSIRNSQLQGAYFSQANLRGALLARVDVTGAHFTEAQLQGTSFQFANGVTSAQLQSAYTDSETTPPMGTETWPPDCVEGH